MPRKSYKKKGKKRVPRKRQNKKGPVTTIVKQPGFTDSMYVKLKYAEEVRIYDAASPSMVYSWRGNSLFDPNYTGTGHQPMYFDQYSLVYEKYRVTGCQITVSSMNYATQTALMVLQSGTDAYIGTDLPTLLEQSRSHKSRLLPVSGRFPSTIKAYCSTRKACGLTSAQSNDQDFSAATTASPAQLWYHNVLFKSQDGATPVNVWAVFQLTFHVQFFDRRIMTQS